MKKNYGRTIRILLMLAAVGGALLCFTGLYGLWSGERDFEIAVALAGAVI